MRYSTHLADPPRAGTAAAKRRRAARSRRVGLPRLVAAGAAVLIGSFLLAGCAGGIDPQEQREALSEVTQAPREAEDQAAVEEYDAESHPDPLVEALDCTDYLVVTSRGTAEPSGGQLLTPVAAAIADARPDDVTVEDLDYPASSEIFVSGTRGVRILLDRLNVQAEACPDQQFVLLGYSQGALVIGDALSPADVRLVGAQAGTLAEEAEDQVLAIVMYGDPRFVGSEPMNSGDYDPSLNGVLPRPPGTLDEYADRLRDYCVAGDPVCQSTINVQEEPHLAYFNNGMQLDGAAFVITRLAPVERDDDTDPSANRDDADAESSGDRDAGVEE